MHAAKWIWCDQSENVNQYAQFMQDFVVDGTVATLYIAADMNYAAFVNGRYVPGFAYSDYPDCRSVDTLDISPYVKKGKNRLCIVGYCQISDSHIYRQGKPGVRFAVYKGEKPLLLSGQETLSRQAPDYESGPMEKITHPLGYTFHYHACKNDGWLEDGYTADNTWHPAVPALNEAALQPRSLRQLTLEEPCTADILTFGSFTDDPMMADKTAGTKMQYAALSYRGRVATNNGPATLPAQNGIALHAEDGDGIYVILDLRKESTGLLELDIELPKEATVYVGFGEHLDDLRVRTDVGKRQFCGVYHAKAGRQTFTHYRKCTRHLKYNIQHVSFEQYDQDLFFEESGFNHLEKQYLKSGNINILVEDPDLMDALLQLPENHLYILLQNIVLKVPMKQIAKKLGISLRTVELYKHDALKTLRRRMIETL